MEVKDKVVVIVGASGGIGSALSKHLARMGAKVVLAGRREELLRQLAEELPGALPVSVDITNPEETQRLIERICGEFGRIDILINCAGQAMFSTVESIDISQYEDLLQLNLVAPLRLMQLVIPHMRTQGGGVIVNVSSMASKRNIPRIAGYASTKSALNSLSLTAREELSKEGITVSVVGPGIVDTDFGRNTKSPEPEGLRRSPNGALLPHVLSPAVVAEKIAELIRSGDAELDIITG